VIILTQHTTEALSQELPAAIVFRVLNYPSHDRHCCVDSRTCGTTKEAFRAV